MAGFEIRARIADAAELKRRVGDLWELQVEIVEALGDSVDRELIGDAVADLAELLLAQARATLVDGLEELERLALTSA